MVVLCCCACICITFYAVANTALTAARHIHNEIMNSLLKAPVDRLGAGLAHLSKPLECLT